MKIIQHLFLAFIAIISIACQSKNEKFSANDSNIRYSGRIDFTNATEPILIGSAAFVEFSFTGDSCAVFLRKLNPVGEHNYVSVEIDGVYFDRIKIEADSLSEFMFGASGESTHTLKIYKATEAQNNHVSFGGVRAKSLVVLPPLPTRKIEFIGNSITCAMGADMEDLPCGEGTWYDQHNAYWSYGTQSSKALNAQFMLSSVSGMGMYRNWNNLGPVMLDVYENLHLNMNETKKYDFSSYNPDLVSICLGTNDMSDGDGKKERLPFDSVQYVQNYLKFIDLVYSKYPETQICLLSSPMMNPGPKRVLLANCLNAISENAKVIYPDKKKIAVFDLLINSAPSGCDYHPSKADHLVMTDKLVPFYKEVMGW